MQQQHATLADKIDQHIFNAIYARSLVYNTCWEDPRVDRQALQLTPQDTLLMITSAGCNALDYALTGVRRIDSVDANPRQTALLELKLAAIRALDFDSFFALFGRGYHPLAGQLYQRYLRQQLSAFARQWWDRRIVWFQKSGCSFYFHGLSGSVARVMRRYLRLRPRLAQAANELFACDNLTDQQRIYDQHIRPEMWGGMMNWLLSRQLTMNMLGVPHPQRRLVQAQHENGVAGFIRASLETVLRDLPIQDNYFWRVYVYGQYTADCCPEYLLEGNFNALKAGLVNCIHPHTCTLTEFLRQGQQPISRFVLLDHMDWMGSYNPLALIEEWDAILARATPAARMIFRSAHAQPQWLQALRIGVARQPLTALLTFADPLAADLSRADRVHTYGGFFIAQRKQSSA